MFDIYGLIDPNTGELRYIGKARNAKDRLKTHIRDARRRKTPVYSWINKLGAAGKRPGLIVLEQVEDWRDAERRWIAEARKDGLKLLNLADGGDEPFCPLEVRQANGRKVAAARNRRIWELKRNLGQLLRDGCVNERTKVKMRFAAQLRPDLFGEWASI